jgi:hypothetical protein
VGDGLSHDGRWRRLALEVLNREAPRLPEPEPMERVVYESPWFEAPTLRDPGPVVFYSPGVQLFVMRAEPATSEQARMPQAVNQYVERWWEVPSDLRARMEERVREAEAQFGPGWVGEMRRSITAAQRAWPVRWATSSEALDQYPEVHRGAPPDVDLVAQQETLAWGRAQASGDEVAEVGRLEDLTGALVDLARAGQREDFLDLAGMSGVGQDEIDPMWRGTRRRLGLEA